MEFRASLSHSIRYPEATAVRHGYKVKRTTSKLTATEQRQWEELANRMLAEAIRPKHIKAASKKIR